MQTENKFVDDLAKLFSGALGAAAGLRGEMEQRLRQPLERLVAQMSLVGREEFEVIKAVAEAARSGQEALVARVAELEARLTRLEGQGTHSE
jgi:BMFP domain-containing protein YqiC